MVYPAHFRDISIVTEKLNMLISLEKCSTGMKQNLPDLVAALVHAAEFIRSNRPLSDVIFRHPLFAKPSKAIECLVDLWKDEVIVSNGRCECCGKMPTGIPNTVLVLFNQEKQEKRLQVLEAQSKVIIDNQNQIIRLLEKKSQIPVQLTSHWWDDLCGRFSVIVEKLVTDQVLKVLRYIS
jgi:hypothetical protein